MTLIPGFQSDPGAVMVWMQVEITLTMICIGIPVCRPLWARALGKCLLLSRRRRRRRSGYVRQGRDDEAPAAQFALHTFGGTPMAKTGESPTSERKPSSNPTILTGLSER